MAEKSVSQEYNDLVEYFVAEARTYLMPVKGYSALLLMGFAGELTPEQLRLIQNIQQASEVLEESCTKLLVEAHTRIRNQDAKEE